MTAGASAGAWQVTYEKALEAGLMTKLKIKKGTSVTYGKQLVKVPHSSPPPPPHLFPSPPLALFLFPPFSSFPSPSLLVSSFSRMRGTLGMGEAISMSSYRFRV
jgi:hypothetical protein